MKSGNYHLLYSALVLLPCAVFAADLDVPFQKHIQPLLKTYCLDCHNADKQKGDLDLSRFGSLSSVQADFKTWQTVLQQIEEEEMPPKKPLPAMAERKALVAWVREAMDTIDWSKHRGIEHITLPRLTKLEYNNTLRDLLGIDFEPGRLLLDDGQGLSGFTNDRDALFISPALAEQLFDAADYALQSVLNLGGKPMQKLFETEAMLMTERSSRPVDLPGGGFGYSLEGAGQRTLYDEIVVPVNGWYRFTVKQVGRGGDAGLRLRIDNEPQAYFFCADEKPQQQIVELLIRAGSHQMTWNIDNSSLSKTVEKQAVKKRAKAKKTVPMPANAKDIVSKASRKNVPELPIPADANDAVKNLIAQFNRALLSMQLRIEWLRVITPEGSPSELRGYYNLLPERTGIMVTVKAQLMQAMNVSADEIDRRLIEANKDKIASNQQVLADSLAVIGVDYTPQFLLGNTAGKKPVKPQRLGAPGVDWIRIEGPITPGTSQPHAIFKTDAREALAEFLPRVFRRPLHEGELKRHLALYDKAKARGESHDQALKLAFTAALTAPSFLFRDELLDGKLNDHQLANRLSYFLWMSMPDDELRVLADAGKLHDEATLRTQVKRMISDPKSRAFTTAFLGQWLDFAGLGSEHVPDAKKFRAFTPALASAMKLEPVLVFENMLRNGGSLTQLLDGRETFANAELAALYEIEGIHGDEMQPMKFTDDRRAGLLGMAAVLTASATPNRTSPVIRGKWVLENLLGRKLAEPPADAGQLDDKAGDRGKTLREELAAHRRNETCAACHDKIDPIGFGLENFDAIGRFRTEEAGKPVDASGQLPGDQNFNGPAELRTLLKTRHQDEFIANLTRRLTAFALGRALKPQDEGLIRLLLADLKKADYRADALVGAIVLSEAFRTQGGTAK